MARRLSDGECQAIFSKHLPLDRAPLEIENRLTNKVLAEVRKLSRATRRRRIRLQNLPVIPWVHAERPVAEMQAGRY